ncbi:MAG: hypothetical protein RL846_34295, partial [Deltaproteobacteria bacterium]
MVRETVEQRGRELLVVGEDLGPFAEGEVRGDEHRAALVPLCNQVEEHLASGAVEGHEAELVEDQELRASDSQMEAADLALVVCFDQHPDEVGRAMEGDTAPLLGGLETEGDREVRLPGADRSREDQVLSASDPLALREFDHLRSRDARCR